jgi:hypothetical protein
MLKGEFHLRTGHEVPEMEQRYNCALPLTSAVNKGGWSRPRLGYFTPWKDPVYIAQEAE